MKDFKILKFLDRFENLFKRLGIDYGVMRRLLGLKLTLDGRRVSTVFAGQNNNKPESENNNNFMKSLGLYGFMGLFLILFITMGDNFLFQMNFVFGLFMFLLMTSLIADFSSVLLDVRDKEILMSKPIDSRTYSMAKILHISFYIGAITVATAGPSLIAGALKQGVVFTIIYLVTIILVTLFTITITALLYLLILRFSNGEKLKDIINYVQIGLAIAMSVGYQIVMRVFDMVDMTSRAYTPSLWKYFVPTVWFAAPFELFINKNYQVYIIIYSVLAVLIPLISIIVYIKLMPEFENSLQKLNSADGQTKNRNKMATFISDLVCSSKEEKVFYKFATKMLKNERTFKLRVYPSLGISVALPFIMVFSMSQNEILKIVDTKSYLFIYLSFLMVPTILGFLRFSGHYKGAWIYKTMPIEDERAIYLGTIKATIINLFLPIFVVSSLVYLFLYRFSILDHILVAGINLLLYTWIIFKQGNRHLPFSEKFGVGEKSAGFFQMMISMVIMGLFALLHYGIALIPCGSYGYIIMAFVVVILRKRFK